MSTLSEIESLAQAVAQEALKEATKLQDKVEALKTLAPYYLSLVKKQNRNDGETDEPTMHDIQTHLRVIEESDNGSGSVPTRNRRRT